MFGVSLTIVSGVLDLCAVGHNVVIELYSFIACACC